MPRDPKLFWMALAGSVATTQHIGGALLFKVAPIILSFLMVASHAKTLF